MDWIDIGKWVLATLMTLSGIVLSYVGARRAIRNRAEDKRTEAEKAKDKAQADQVQAAEARMREAIEKGDTGVRDLMLASVQHIRMSVDNAKAERISLREEMVDRLDAHAKEAKETAAEMHQDIKSLTAAVTVLATESRTRMDRHDEEIQGLLERHHKLRDDLTPKLANMQVDIEVLETKVEDLRKKAT